MDALHGRSLRALAFAALLASFACQPTRKAEEASAHPGTHDPRTPVALPADGQQAVLHEMRDLLAAIGGALSAAAQADTAAVLAAIAPAGSAAAADPELEELLPPGWMELAERMHGGFDSLALAVRRTRGGQELKDTVMVGLARISASCMACHETFRIAVH